MNDRQFALDFTTVSTPAARRRDPSTSHRAAEEHTASGVRGQHQKRAAQAVVDFPGRTSQELSRDAKLDRYMLARRLPECEEALVVRRGPARACSVTGKQALTWWPR
jgi:hypothetical protein